MKIAVLGTGYVGLVAGAGFSDFGNEVTCVDIDAEKIARLKQGILPIYEPGLETLVESNIKEGRLAFSTDIDEAVQGSEVVLIAVGTPSSPDGSADLSYVLAAAESIGKAMQGYTVVMTKSTVPVDTGDKIEAVLKKTTKEQFSVVSNPEFLKEGDAVNDFMKPDRVIIGTNDEKAREVLKQLYGPFVRTNDRVMFMDRTSAELTKYAANAMLATRISFMNDIANLCERVGADVEMVRRGIGTDQRIGPRFLFPGIGYGGSCFPKDVRAAMSTAHDAGTKLEILEAVHRVNERQKGVLADKIAAHFGGPDKLMGKTIAVWGLAFKPGTDDVREAPAAIIIGKLHEWGCKILAHDPVANEAMVRMFGDKMMNVCDKNYDALKGAHALALVTEWHEFRRPNFKKMKQLMAEPNLFDGRNIWDPAEVRKLGFTYYGIGRP